ncbi:MAG: hypothetical protein M3O94_07950 [Actinomycetota bacterium]|nr:hypothetical protein [Actinomycetota bacterium]
MCSWCRQGPSHARVESVGITVREVEGSTGFEIR